MTYRQRALFNPIEGFKVGDIVKFRKPINEYEAKLFLVIDSIYDKDNTVCLKRLDDKPYSAIVNVIHIKKIKEGLNG